MKPGDVVIEGGNALDYKNKPVGVDIGSPDSGTTGTIFAYVVGRKAYLVIPIGLWGKWEVHGNQVIAFSA